MLLTPRSVPMMEQYIYKNRFMPAYKIAAELNAYSFIKISEGSKRRYIKRLNIKSYVSEQKSYLSSKNIVARIHWARVHEKWDSHMWSRVTYTDESSFAVHPLKQYIRVWRRKGERYNQQCTTPTFKSRYKLISVWGAFSARGRTTLVRIRGHFNQQVFKDIIDNFSSFYGSKSWCYWRVWSS